MNTNKYTPGPWSVYEDAGSTHPSPIVTGWDDDESFDVAVIPYSPTAMHDARLIAAAPDMLHALRQALPFIGFEGAGDQEAVNLVRTTIAKATGEAT